MPEDKGNQEGTEDKWNDPKPPVRTIHDPHVADAQLDVRATDFELEQWEKDANRLILCTWCGGSGHVFARQYRHEEGEWKLCGECHGEGRRRADLHVVRLVRELREHRKGNKQ